MRRTSNTSVPVTRHFQALRNFISLIFCLLIAAGVSATAQSIKIAGSDTMLTLNKGWASEFHRLDRKITFQVTGGGTQVGLQALREGNTDIAASSRPLSAVEKEEFKKLKGLDLIEIPVAMDVVAIYVHDSNFVPLLTMEQLSDIFSGKITHWSQIGGRKQPIYVYIRDVNSGTHVFFKDYVLNGEKFSNKARPVETTAELTEIISYNSNAIGFGGYAYGKAVRYMPVATQQEPLGHKFDPDSVATDNYPLNRSLYFYFDPKSVTPELKRFLQWVLGEEGQSIVAGVGYFPLPKSDVDKTLSRLGWADTSAQANLQPLTDITASSQKNSASGTNGVSVPVNASDKPK